MRHLSAVPAHEGTSKALTEALCREDQCRCGGCAARRAAIDEKAGPPRSAQEIAEAVRRSWAQFGDAS